MILLDSNIFIYLANGTITAEAVSGFDIAHSVITEIEVLGYHRVTAQELLLLHKLLDESTTLMLTEPITAGAITVRQQQNSSLGDSIVAATALVHRIPLWTANTKDFQHIEELDLVNPLD